MSKNIYDIFNERKSGIETLVEGTDVVDYEEYDSIEEAVYAMEEIIQEATNDCIEYKAASYLEDLVIENLMYNAFDEENIQNILTESIGSRTASIIERLRKAWESVKGWFKSIKATIAKALHLSAEWVDENEEKILDGIKNCNTKVKYLAYYDFKGSQNRVLKMINSLFDACKNPNFTEKVILSKVGVKDRSQVPNAVKKCFMKYDEPQVVTISSIPGDIIVDWAACKNEFVDLIEKLEEKQNKRFETVISTLQSKAEGSDENDKIYSNFVFANGIAQTITSTAVTIVKKACSDCMQIARKAAGVKMAVKGAAGRAVDAYEDAKARISLARESYEVDYDDDDILEEGLLNKFRKLGVEELEEKIQQLQAAVADIEEGNGPKKFLKKAKSELKEAQKALANKQKKGEKAEAKAAKKAAKAEAKAAKKAAKNGGGELPAAESFMLDFDEIEFEDDFE